MSAGSREGLGLARVPGDKWTTWGGSLDFDGVPVGGNAPFREIARFEGPCPQVVQVTIVNGAPVAANVEFEARAGLGRVTAARALNVASLTTGVFDQGGQFIRLMARHTGGASAAFQVVGFIAPWEPSCA